MNGCLRGARLEVFLFAAAVVGDFLDVDAFDEGLAAVDEVGLVALLGCVVARRTRRPAQREQVTLGASRCGFVDPVAVDPVLCLLGCVVARRTRRPAQREQVTLGASRCGFVDPVAVDPVLVDLDAEAGAVRDLGRPVFELGGGADYRFGEEVVQVDSGKACMAKHGGKMHGEHGGNAGFDRLGDLLREMNETERAGKAYRKFALNCQDRDRPIPIGCMVLSMK